MASARKNYIYNLILALVNLLFPIVSFPYASRILGPSGIGKAQFVVSFAQYFALFAALGIPVYGIREIAKAKGNYEQLSKTFSELILIYFGTSLIVGFCYIIVVLTVPSLAQNRDFYLTGSILIFIGFSTIDWFYAGIEEFKVIAIRSVIIKVITMVLLFLLVKTHDDVFMYFLLTIVTLIGNNAINIISVWKRVKFVTKNLNLRVHRKPLILIFSTTLALSMYTLFDVLILGFMSDDEAVGYYTSGVKLVKVCVPIVISMGTILLPKIASYLHSGEMGPFYKLIGKSYSFVVFISVPLTFGLFLLSKEFIIVFSGQQFLESVNSMKILSILPLLIGMGHLFGSQVLITSNRDKEMLIGVSLGMVSSVLFNVLLIPKFRQEGAAIANVIAEGVVTGSFFYFASLHYRLKLQIKPFMQAIVACLVFIPVIYLLRLQLGNYTLVLLVGVVINATLYTAIQHFIFKNELMRDILIEAKKRLNLAHNE